MKTVNPPHVAVVIIFTTGPLGVVSTAMAATTAGAYSAAAVTLFVMTAALGHAVLWARRQQIPAPVIACS
jgi:hypothetical protein